MNKKGSAITAILNAAFLIAAIYFIVFVIFGFGGGFKLTYDVGKLAAQIPTWAWLGLGLIVLISLIRGKK